MAQLKDTVINGDLAVSNDIILQTNNTCLYGIHPSTGERHQMIYMSSNGNTVVGSGGYSNANGNTHIYGKDVYHYVASAGNVHYKPYYSAGDSISMILYTAGFVTSGGASIRFLVPLSKPIIGNPTITITSDAGLTLRQDTKYTHGSGASTSVKPSKYETIGYTDGNTNSNGFAIVATMSDTTNVTNNDTLGVYWSGTITFS